MHSPNTFLIKTCTTKISARAPAMDILKVVLSSRKCAIQCNLYYVFTNDIQQSFASFSTCNLGYLCSLTNCLHAQYLHGKLGELHELLKLGPLVNLKVGLIHAEPALFYIHQALVNRGAQRRHPCIFEEHLSLVGTHRQTKTYTS